MSRTNSSTRIVVRTRGMRRFATVKAPMRCIALNAAANDEFIVPKPVIYSRLLADRSRAEWRWRSMVQPTRRILYTALAATVLCFTVACSSAPPRTPEQQRADDQLEQQVESALNSDPNIYAAAIRVHADKGVVRLGGYVWNDEDLYRARSVAEHVPGVTKVVSELRLEREGRKGGQ